MEFQLLAPLIQAGPVGVMLLWFMFRLEKHIKRSNKVQMLLVMAVLRRLEKENPSAASDLMTEYAKLNGD